MTEPSAAAAVRVTTLLSLVDVDRRLAVVNSLTDEQRNHLLGALSVLVTFADFAAAVARAEDCFPRTVTVSR